jgi:hypothetical protein
MDVARPAVAELTFASGKRGQSVSLEVAIVVLTRDSESWIAALCAYYRSLNVPVMYAVDSRTSDSTPRVLQELGETFAIVRGAEPRAEAMIIELSRIVDCKWILRLDDDECASRQLLEWVASRFDPARQQHKIVSFARRWLWLDAGGKLEYLASKSWDAACEDRQYRLFDSTAVTYTIDIHTPGFRVDAATEAPASCPIYHLDWVLRSAAERTAKMAHYDRQFPGAGSDFARFYLPETMLSWEERGPIRDDGVERLARSFREAQAARDRIAASPTSL